MAPREIGTVRPVGSVRRVESGRAVGLVGQGKKLAEEQEQEDLEARMEREMRDLERNLNESMNDVSERLAAERAMDYSVTLCFQTQAQKLAFMALVKWDDIRDGPTYLDGDLMAKKLGLVLPPGPDWGRSYAKPKPRFAALAMDPPPAVPLAEETGGEPPKSRG